MLGFHPLALAIFYGKDSPAAKGSASKPAPLDPAYVSTLATRILVALELARKIKANPQATLGIRPWSGLNPLEAEASSFIWEKRDKHSGQASLTFYQALR